MKQTGSRRLTRFPLSFAAAVAGERSFEEALAEANKAAAHVGGSWASEWLKAGLTPW
jgi:Pyruvate/2-oxoacid:ferredoxin oxidoreductase gamma subunit